MKFKPTIPDVNGKIKGNVDADLVLRAMIDINEYNQAVIVSSDGDFYSLVQYLNEKNKLCAVLSSDSNHCSGLLKQMAKDKIQYMHDLNDKLGVPKNTN